MFIVVLGCISSNLAYTQCSVSINKVTVSGCYYVNNQSKATVNVEVEWSNAPANDSIEVALGNVKRYIRPGTFQVSYPATTTKGNQTIVSPQVVAFEVNATGSGSSVTAHFTTQLSCEDSENIQLPAACPPITCSGTQTGGTVFNDYDADGIKDAGEINGVSQVTVKAIDCNGTVYTATTDGFGKYVLTIPQTHYPIRVEFLDLPAYAGQGTPNGDDGRTTVQFVAAPDCNVDLGILDKNDYCQTTPKVVVPCYVYGNPAAGSESGLSDALVAFDYGTSGPKDMSKITVLAKAQEIGTVWGLAFDKYTNKVYTSATVKRHAGIGPLGLGGIYVTDMATNTTSAYIDVSASPLNINVGASTAADPWFGVTNTGRGLVTDPTQPSSDSLAFELIGKIGIGDLEISEDGQALYFINLYDKKLYKLDISGATPALAGSWSIPDPGCTGGTLRPFATKVYKGKVYIGSVCDASTSDKSNLRGFVNAFDGTSFTQVFDFPLTYPKGAVLINTATINIVGWYPWTDNFNVVNSETSNGIFTRVLHPQPMLTDIEFDIDGSMVLALGDRTGLQAGYNNYRPSGTGVYTGLSGGDILRAAFTNGTYILENNGKVPGSNGAGVNNNQGPGFGEFYNDDFLGGNGALTHAEIGFGALALRPGSGQVIMTAMDPVDQNASGTNFSGGIRYLSNTTGLSPSGSAMGFVLYNTNNEKGTFGKSTGLGDLEISCALPQYIEIGNRVWVDTDRDGVQDACEKALKNVNVSLYKGNTLIATSKTDANGEYFFSSKSGIGTGTWSGSGADTTLLQSTAYTLVFGTGSQMSANGDTLKLAGLGKFLLTQKDATANTGNDLNDSDAAKTSIAGGNYPTIDVTTGLLGTVNHTLDAGFYCINPFNYAAKVTQATCTGVTANNNAKIELTAITCADKYAFSKNSAGFTGAAYAAATAITGSTITFNNLTNPATAAGDTFYVRLYNGSCCYKDTAIVLPFKDCSCVKPVVTVTAKSQAVCEGSTPAPFMAATTPSTGLTLKWYGPLADTTGTLPTALMGQTNPTFTPTVNFTGTKYFAVIATGTDASCSDTAFVSLTVNPRPNASVTPKKQTLCPGDLPSAYTAAPGSGVSYVWYGALSDTTAGLGTAIAGATSASFTPSGAAVTTPGTKYYAVVVTNTQTSCKDTAFVQLTVNAKPNAGPDMTGGSAVCNTAATADLPDAANGESWSQLGNSPKAVTVNPASGIVNGMDAVGTYQFILKNTTTQCADTVSVEVKNCLKGSIGDLVWKDTNNNGIQDLPAEKGVKGVIIQLLNADNNDALLATDTTDANGIYSFNGLDSGTYKVKIVLSSLPDSCKISPKQDVTTGGGNDTNDSDFNPTSGESPVVTINTLGSGLQKDNPTIDAALIVPCIKPSFTLTDAPVCSADVQTYSVSFSVTGKNGLIKVNKGILTGNNPYTVTGIPSGATLRIVDSLSAVCTYDTLITGPNCNCTPPLPILITPSQTACIGDTFPTIKAMVIGLATVEWFTTASGGTPVFTGLNYKPTGAVTGDTIFYAQARSTDPSCPTAISTSRVAATINAQNCQVDLALKKLISTKIAQLGDTLTYTIKVWNEFINNASGVEVTDSIAATVEFITNSFTASRGTAAINGNVIKWTIGNIAAAGDTVTLTYKVKAVQEGVHFNTAEISRTNEKDKDSTPGNAKDNEDDLDRQCFTVPVKLCPGEKMQVSVPTKYVNVKWFKAGMEITSLAGQNTVLLSQTGIYTFTADNNTCPTEGCCPVIIEPGNNCCPDELCVPFTIKKTKKSR